MKLRLGDSEMFLPIFFGPPPTNEVWIERVNPKAKPLERPNEIPNFYGVILSSQIWGHICAVRL